MVNAGEPVFSLQVSTQNSPFWLKKNKQSSPKLLEHTMATIIEQTEKTYLKQDGAILGGRNRLTGKALSSKLRYYRDIGLGFKVPPEAIKGQFVDKKCPFTGNVSIRGRILRGIIVSTKMKRTVIVRRDYLHYLPKYNRFEKRHTNIPAHCSPAFTIKEGDLVTIGQCRPLSKTIRFNVLKVQAQTETQQAKKVFRQF